MSSILGEETYNVGSFLLFISQRSSCLSVAVIDIVLASLSDNCYSLAAYMVIRKTDLWLILYSLCTHLLIRRCEFVDGSWPDIVALYLVPTSFHSGCRLFNLQQCYYLTRCCRNAGRLAPVHHAPHNPICRWSIMADDLLYILAPRTFLSLRIVFSTLLESTA